MSSGALSIGDSSTGNFSILNNLILWKSCITLRHTPLRTLEAQREFADNGFHNVTFYIADKSSNPIEGCYNSHLNVMKQALMDGVEYALVFEDDVKFVKDNPKLQAIQREIKQFITTTPFDIMYLGWCAGYESFYYNCVRKSTKLPGYDFIYKSNCACTHAVIYSREFMQRFVDEYSEFSGHIDQVFLKIPNIRMYMVVPTLFDQKWCFSTMDYGKSKCVSEKVFNSERFANYLIYSKQYMGVFGVLIILAVLFIIGAIQVKSLRTR